MLQLGFFFLPGVKCVFFEGLLQSASTRAQCHEAMPEYGLWSYCNELQFCDVCVWTLAFLVGFVGDFFACLICRARDAPACFSCAGTGLLYWCSAGGSC